MMVVEKRGDFVRHWHKLTIMIGLIAFIDQVSGYWARRALKGGRTLVLVHPILSFHLLFNRGAMLGLGSRIPSVITAIGVLGTVLLVVLAMRIREWEWPLAVMAGGAVGNVVSRLWFGRVTDFVQISGHPGIFNVSDVALQVGVIWLILRMVIGEVVAHTRQQRSDLTLPR